MSDPVVVQALYTFKGSNNDELFFRKGDLITITQKDDGGWWEGTLGDVTGWFPVNYVREVKDMNIMQQLVHSIQPDVQNLSIVYKDLLDSERAHVNELQALLSNFLLPLEKSTILTSDEYKQLTANFGEVLDTHQELLRLIDGEIQKPHRDQRTGKSFLNYAPRMKSVHQLYRSLHPKAVCIIDKYREELSKYMESCGANCPGVLVLTTGLSKPFRRLAKYSGMLLEVERHVEDSHPDRGDIQRSVAVYKELEATCEALRRQKEIELQILTGPVRGWEGQSLSSLGDIIYMGSVAVEPQHLDRYLVLFPTTLLILSISHRLSGFIYEGKLPVTGITVAKLEDGEQYKNAFEISGPLIEKVIAVCQSREEAKHWVDILAKSNPARCASKALPSKAEFVPQPPPHLNQRGYCNRMSVVEYQPQCDYVLTPPCRYYPPASPYAGLSKLYARMVKLKVINRKLLKLLTHPEICKVSVATLNVARRQHRSECFLMRRGSKYRNSFVEASDSDSEESSGDASDGARSAWKPSRQHAFDRISGETGTNSFGYIRYRNECSISTLMDYENGCSEVNVIPENPPSVVLTSSTSLQLLAPLEDSENSLYMVAGSLLDDELHEVDVGGLDTPMRTFWGMQVSQESDMSSSIVPNNACEDLAGLSENYVIHEQGRHKLPADGLEYVPKMRASCPNKLVADKFNTNHNSLTTLNIPQCNSDGNLVQARSGTHSSTLDIPINTLPVPDAILAELLYNPAVLERVDELDDGLAGPIKPPTLFRNTDSASSAEGLRKSNIGFRKHSINSDKMFKRRSSLPADDSSCASLHSTDSGVAGSCTLNSPDFPPLHDTPKLDSVLSEMYEEQCRCTSPFGSTPPRSSAHLAHARSPRSSTASIELPGVPPPWQSVSQIHHKLAGIRLQQSASLGTLSAAADPGHRSADTYRSGLYAHWWLKTAVPRAVMKGILEAARRSPKPAAVLRTHDSSGPTWTGPIIGNEQLKRLQQRLKNVECNMETLTGQLVEERAARLALQVIVKRYLPVKDADLIIWPTIEGNISS